VVSVFVCCYCYFDLYYAQMSNVMDKFEKQFDDLDITSQFMDQAISQSTGTVWHVYMHAHPQKTSDHKRTHKTSIVIINSMYCSCNLYARVALACFCLSLSVSPSLSLSLSLCVFTLSHIRINSYSYVINYLTHETNVSSFLSLFSVQPKRHLRMKCQT